MAEHTNQEKWRAAWPKIVAKAWAEFCTCPRVVVPDSRSRGWFHTAAFPEFLNQHVKNRDNNEAEGR